LGAIWSSERCPATGAATARPANPMSNTLGNDRINLSTRRL